MSVGVLFNAIGNELLTQVVKNQASELTAKASCSDLATIERYLVHPSPEVKNYSIACLIMNLNTTTEKSIESIRHIPMCLEFAKSQPHLQASIYYFLDSAVEGLMRIAEKPEDLFILASAACNINNYVKENPQSICLSFNTSQIIIKTKLWPKAQQIVEKPDGPLIFEFLHYINEFQKIGFDFTELKSSIISGILDFIDFRNGFVPRLFEYQEGLQEDYDIVDLLKSITKPDEEIRNRINEMETKLQGRGERKKFKQPAPDKLIKSRMILFLKDIKLKALDEMFTIPPGSMPLFARRTETFQVSIYKGYYQKKEVAIKGYTPLTQEADVGRVINEAKFCQVASELETADNCFLKYYGSCFADNTYYLVMEYVQRDLMDILTNLKKEPGFAFTDVQIIPIFCKMIRSFAQLESYHLYHGDIKPRNMLVDNYWNIKIIDYSISAVRDEDRTSLIGEIPLQGTVGYTAPEIFTAMNQGLSKTRAEMSKTDVFSLGITMLQMLTLRNLEGLNDPNRNKELLMIVDSLQYEWAKPILRKMLIADPLQRSRFTDLLQDIVDENTKTMSRQY